MTAAPDFSCRELVEIVTDYLEGSLSGAERARFELHLTICPGCRVYLAQIHQIRETARRVAAESLAPEARETLLAAFRQWKRGPAGE